MAYSDPNYQKTYQRKWASQNPEKKASYDRSWYLKNKKQRCEYIKEYNRKRRALDVNFRLLNVLRARLGASIRKNFKSGSAVQDLGCSIPELKNHIEAQFQPGMSWENWGIDGWNIDHKIPLAFFNLTDRKQLLQAVHYTNLQPLWARDNKIKQDKVEGVRKRQNLRLH